MLEQEAKENKSGVLGISRNYNEGNGSSYNEDNGSSYNEDNGRSYNPR